MTTFDDIKESDNLIAQKINTFGEILDIVISKAADEILKINNAQKQVTNDTPSKPQNRTLTYTIKSKQISILIYEQMMHICFDFGEIEHIKVLESTFKFICEQSRDKSQTEAVNACLARLFEILNAKYASTEKYDHLYENLTKKIHEETGDVNIQRSRYYNVTPLDIIFKKLSSIASQQQMQDEKGIKAVKLIAEIKCNLNGPAAFEYVNTLIPKPNFIGDRNTKKCNEPIIAQVYSKLHQLFKANVIPKKYSDNYEKIMTELRNMNFVEYVRIVKLCCAIYYQNEYYEYPRLFSALEIADRSIELPLDLSKFPSLKKNIGTIECYEASGSIQPITYTINVDNHTFGCKILKGKNEQIQSVFDCFSIDGKSLHDQCWSSRLENFKRLAPNYSTINVREINQAQIDNIIATKDRSFSIYVKTIGFGVGTEFKYITTSKRLAKERIDSNQELQSKKRRLNA